MPFSFNYQNGKIQFDPANAGAFFDPFTGLFRISKGSGSAVSPVSMTGGIETDINLSGVDYRIHAFETSGGFSVASGGVVDIMLVGGGGGAGGYAWNAVTGGGGAGGLLLLDSYDLSTGDFTVIVGAGGAGTTYLGSRGNDTEIVELGLVALGGGRPGRNNIEATPGSYGSGGGGGGGAFTSAGSAGTPGQGYDGANGLILYGFDTPGGGGGAGEPGEQKSNGPGRGGDGLDMSGYFGGLYGDTRYPGWFAGGGTGAAPNQAGKTTFPSAALGGGGRRTAPGQVNTGGGGGGNTTVSSSYQSGTSGGSGIVLIRYPI